MKIELEKVLHRGVKKYKLISFEGVKTLGELPSEYTTINTIKDTYFFKSFFKEDEILLHYGLVSSEEKVSLESSFCILKCGNTITLDKYSMINDAIIRLKTINERLLKENVDWNGKIYIK